MTIYHSVASSSFDADRLDFFRRDRLMIGAGAGAIDFDWLMEQVRVSAIAIEAADPVDDADQERVPTFCFDMKALPAAEQFLLARYALHEQVYFHKTTRCIEHMIEKLLRRVAESAHQRDRALACRDNRLALAGREAGDWRSEVTKRKEAKVRHGRLERAVEHRPCASRGGLRMGFVGTIGHLENPPGFVVRTI
jgi:HD superfamily phosphohydrolase